MNYERKIAGFILVASGLVSACSPGTGEGLDSNGNPITSSTQPVALRSDFVSIQANVFTSNCALSGCHTGASAPLGLQLDEANSFVNIFDQPSSEDPGSILIIPGDPDNSYLVRKIEGTAGSRMPKDLPALSPQKIQAIREWVTNGALGPSLKSIQRNVFTPLCTSCHFGLFPAGNMNLEDGLARSNLVGIKRPFDPEIRVVASDADSSFLIDKLEGNNLGGSRGDRMPFGGLYLDQGSIDALRIWIDQGAADN